MAGRRTIEESSRAHLELLFDLYNKGVKIGEKNISALMDAGFLARKNGTDPVAMAEDGSEVKLAVSELFSVNIISEKSIYADRHISILYTDKQLGKERFVSDTVLSDVIVKKSIYSGVREITREEWLPASTIDHTQEFYDWINSINDENGFFNSIKYDKFDLYCMQAEQWMNEQTPPSMNEEELLEWRVRENDRCAFNSLYAADRYGEIKEDNEKAMKYYKAQKAHKILLFLLDSGYSLDIVKARQVAFTTTICLWALIKGAFNENVRIKYISEDKDKAISTAGDKIKYPYSKFPEWLRPNVNNDNLTQFLFGKKAKKGDMGGNNSSVDVVGPGRTKIASTTPTVTLIDETGNINTLGDLLSDLWPTVYGFNVKTNRQELLRQVVMWGTGGYMDNAGVALHGIFMNHWDQWKERNFSSGIIPLFMNVWYRPGMTKELYAQLKKEAYSEEGPKAAERRIRFHQGFPITLEDVFLTGGNTLKPMEYIQANLTRISDSGFTLDYGYFEPIFDIDKPSHEGSDVPFVIKGANFVPVSYGDERATTIIFMHPKRWRNRYYQGTDPISSDNGHSKMASAIWDSHFACPVALMNYRSNNYRYAFLQTTLLGMYYNCDTAAMAVPELVESNIGTAYREYKENKGLDRTLVLGSELPRTLQTSSGSVIVGVDNKGLRNKVIIDYMHQIFDSFGDRIFMPIFFNQLKTFVCKMIGRSEVWEPQDKRYNWDDALFALTYSYICASCYTFRVCEPIDGDPSTKSVRASNHGFKLVRDSNGYLRRVPLRMK